MGLIESEDKINAKYRVKLNKFYRILKDQILQYQHPISGLFPLNPDKENCKISHVRDSVYCATATWALYQCFQKIDDDEGRTYELGQCAVKCMRTILIGWMQQCDRLESFKSVQSGETCLFSILDYATGEPRAPDNYPHLQMDCVALYLLQLTQMITSGLQVIYTKTEVCFVQNLVFYLERSYRIPDYGMWERGSKQNKNITELHSSSIGLAQAALEAVSGFNMFGDEGDHSTVIFVDSDAHSRNRIIMTNLLPRESASKGADSALIPTLSWPGFATHSGDSRDVALSRVTARFHGKYGYKRFSRDGHCTVLEKNQIYDAGELKKFENIENEWPIFLAYMVIESCFKQNMAEAESYNTKLTSLMERSCGEKYVWMPKFFYVPEENIEKERAKPGSSKRESSFFLPDECKFLWGQAVYIISQLLYSNCLLLHDLDPLMRHIPAEKRAISHSQKYSTLMGKPLNLIIQVVLISESVRLQQMLATYGIQTQTPHQVEPIQLWPPDQLVRVGQYMGCSEKLGLSGRPARPVGQLGTSKFYRISGVTVLCYPLLFEAQDFYLLHDMNVVIEECKHDFTFLSNWWRMKGRPTFCMLIKEDMIKSPDADSLINFLASMKTGKVDGVRVMLGRAQNFVASSCMEHLDFMQQRTNVLSEFKRVRQLDVSRSFRSLTDIARIAKSEAELSSGYEQAFLDNCSSHELVDMVWTVESLFSQTQLLHTLLRRHGLKHEIGHGRDPTSIEGRLAEVCRKAGVLHNWYVVRFCSALLGKFVNSLAPNLSAILVSGKQILMGVAKKPDPAIISKPMNPKELLSLLLTSVYPHDQIQMVLQQELILYVSNILTKKPELFRGISVIRLGWLVEAMKLTLQIENRSESSLYSFSPTDVKATLERTLVLGRCVAPSHSSPDTAAFYTTGELPSCTFAHNEDTLTPFWSRQMDGCLGRVPDKFYSNVYKILSRSPRGVKIYDEILHQFPTLQDMTPTDLNFVDTVEGLLQAVNDPAYRCIIIEAIMVTAIVLERNEELQFNDTVSVTEIIQDAMQEFRKDRQEINQQDMDKDTVYKAFFTTAPNIRLGTTSYLAKVAINHLLHSDINLDHVERDACILS